MPLLYSQHRFGNLYTNMRAHKRRQVCGKWDCRAVLALLQVKHRATGVLHFQESSQLCTEKGRSSSAEWPQVGPLEGWMVDEALSICCHKHIKDTKFWERMCLFRAAKSCKYGSVNMEIFIETKGYVIWKKSDIACNSCSIL